MRETGSVANSANIERPTEPRTHSGRGGAKALRESREAGSMSVSDRNSGTGCLSGVSPTNLRTAAAACRGIAGAFWAVGRPLPGRSNRTDERCRAAVCKMSTIMQGNGLDAFSGFAKKGTAEGEAESAGPPRADANRGKKMRSVRGATVTCCPEVTGNRHCPSAPGWRFCGPVE